jgi:hypothetical protein
MSMQACRMREEWSPATSRIAVKASIGPVAFLFPRTILTTPDPCIGWLASYDIAQGYSLGIDGAK